MYKVKQVPEDFIVKELYELKLDDDGRYSYFLLKKKNFNTLRALEIISRELKINLKNIGFSGNKDKNAVSEQVISIPDASKNIEKIKLKDIELGFLGNGKEKIFLGSASGNEFIITIRNLKNNEIEYIKNKVEKGDISLPNYFGEQRFSSKNTEIGRSIIKKNFKQAIEFIIETNSDSNQKIINHLEKQKNDFVGALKIIPFRLLKLYVHAYQSLIFNKSLEEYIISSKNNEEGKRKINKNKKIPIIGFGTELEDKAVEKIINKILENEKITLRDFIIRAIPDLSVEGSERNAFARVIDFEIIKNENDELNPGKEKIAVKFSLPKGCYATVLIDYLFK